MIRIPESEYTKYRDWFLELKSIYEENPNTFEERKKDIDALIKDINERINFIEANKKYLSHRFPGLKKLIDTLESIMNRFSPFLAEEDSSKEEVRYKGSYNRTYINKKLVKEFLHGRDYKITPEALKQIDNTVEYILKIAMSNATASKRKIINTEDIVNEDSLDELL